MTKKNLQFFLLRPDNIFKIIINKDFSVCQKLSKTRFLSKNVSSAGFHFDGIIGVVLIYHHAFKLAWHIASFSFCIHANTVLPTSLLTPTLSWIKVFTNNVLFNSLLCNISCARELQTERRWKFNNNQNRIFQFIINFNEIFVQSRQWPGDDDNQPIHQS